MRVNTAFSQDSGFWVWATGGLRASGLRAFEGVGALVFVSLFGWKEIMSQGGPVMTRYASSRPLRASGVTFATTSVKGPRS